MAGYSGTPLAKKLGIKEGAAVCAIAAPKDYQQLLKPLPDGVTFGTRVSAKSDIIHIFATQRSKLQSGLMKALATMRDDATIWVSWPKKRPAAKVKSDITEDVIREIALPMGLVDVKVCAVDDTWSGLKLVVRVENRQRRGGR